MIEVRGLSVSLASPTRSFTIVDDVSFFADKGEILGIVGESGCGKSTIVKALLGLVPPGLVRRAERMAMDGLDVTAIAPEEMHEKVRGVRLTYVPQDPYLSLNPVFRIGTQIAEVGRKLGLTLRDAAFRERVHATLRRMQFDDPEAILKRYPHELSGGQRQRVLIAAALIPNPSVILADEPTTALDVTTQKQIAALIRDLATASGVTVIFVSHDLGLIAELSDRVLVMYAGQGVEFGRTREVIGAPRHPYTQALLRCHPDRSPDLRSIAGEVPDVASLGRGCRFMPRCDHAMPACADFPGLPATARASARYASCIMHEAEALVS